MTAVLAGVTTLTTVVGDIFTMITANAFLTVLLAGSLVTAGIAIFRKLKKSAH